MEQSVISYGVERYWQPRKGARHGLLPNSAGTGGIARLVPIFFIGQRLLSGNELPKQPKSALMCAARIGTTHPLVKNSSPYGNCEPIGGGALSAATIETG